MGNTFVLGWREEGGKRVSEIYLEINTIDKERCLVGMKSRLDILQHRNGGGQKQQLLDKGTMVWSCLYAVIILLVYIISKLFTFDKITSSPAYNFFSRETLPPIKDLLLVFALVFLISCILMKVYGKIDIFVSGNVAYSDRALKLMTVSIFVFLLVEYLFFFIVFYPGVSFHDSLIIAKSGWRMSGQHPVMYCLFVQFCMDIGYTIFNSGRAGYAIYCIVQIVVTCGCITYCILWIAKKNVKKVWIFLAVLYYVSSMLIINYSMNMLKDTGYGLCVLLWIIIIFDAVQSDGENILTEMPKFILLFLLTIFIRNNGLHVMLGISIILVCICKRKVRLFLICLACIFVSQIPNQVVARMGQQQLFKERVGIPLQQMAATVWYGGELDDHDEQFLAQIMPLEELKNRYTPCTVDSLKWGGAPIDNAWLNENKSTFIRKWLSIGLKNKKIYTKAWLANTIGYWGIGLGYENYNTSFVLGNSSEGLQEFIERNNLKNKNLLPYELNTHIKEIYEKCIIKIPASIYFWIFILSMAAICSQKRYKWCLAMFPLLITFGTLLLSAPIAWSLRYMFPFVMCLPLIVLMPVLASRNYEMGKRKG